MVSSDSIMERHEDRQPLDGSPLADIGERKAIFAVLDSFRQYRKQTHFSTTHRRRQNFYALSSQHQDLLNTPEICFLDNLIAVDDAIDQNADLADRILETALDTFELSPSPEPNSEMDWQGTARSLDLSKASSTIRQFWRDWSRDGFNTEVRPVLERISQSVDGHLHYDGGARILLPGAGLGRLLFELCMRGHAVEGNEISYHQLMASNFVLNATSNANEFSLFPFISSFNNHQSRAHQLQCVQVPDVHPATEMTKKSTTGGLLGEMNMTAGDFITSYSSFDSTCTFDAVATIYFIDTAPNLIRYIETVRNCLVDGGIWINCGPLLWHFDNQTPSRDQGGEDAAKGPNAENVTTGIAEPGTFELTDDETLTLVQKFGFELLSHEILDESEGGYIQDRHSMLQSKYRCSFWVMRKTVAK